jgi:nucleoside-diphosphate-sugar epimerase
MSLILLTGAAGFIGAFTARQLLDAGHQVVGVDNLNDYYDPQLKRHRLETIAAGDAFEFEPIDIEDYDGLDSLFERHRFDAVLNLAARAGVRYSVENPHVYLQTNAQGTLNLLELMRRDEVRKMVLASTSSLYAGHEIPFTEEMPVNRPLSPYAASKKAAEAMAYSYHHLHGIDVTVVRYFTVYGPAGRPDMSPFRFIKWIYEETPITLYGDGGQSRDFTYIDDIARGTVLAMMPLGYEIVNLGGGREPVTILELIRRIEQRLGKRARIDRRPAVKADMRDTRAEISKAQRLLGWSPRTDLDEGLDRAVDWFLRNLPWSGSIDV